MGEMIVFRPSTKHRRGRADVRDGSRPRVLVFTGVRYQRHDLESAPSNNDPGLFAPRNGGAGGGKRRKRG